MVEFDNYKLVDKGVCAAKGFKAGGINVGIKAGNIVGRNHGIARGFEHILKKFRALPFAIACYKL